MYVIEKESNFIPQSNSTMQTACITSRESFEEVKDDWNNLLAKSRESHPFISWEWQYTWWETYSEKKDELMIITVFDGDKLVGIAPFYIKQYPFHKALMFIGDGEPDEESITTHYQDLICEEKYSDEVIDGVSNYLKQNNKWSFSRFSFLLDQSYLFSVHSKLKAPLSIQAPLGYQYRIDLKNCFNKLYESLSKSTRKQFRLKRNRMQKIAPLDLIDLDIESSIDECFAKLGALHTHRQTVKGEDSIFLEPRFIQFHLNLLQRLRGTNRAKIRALKHGDNIIACVLNYVSTEPANKVIYSYATGFKSSDDKRFSPLFVFDLLDFEHSIDQQFTHYDLLSADGESSYKDAYNATKSPVSRLYWFNLSLFGIGRFLTINLRRVGSKIKARYKTIT